MELLRVGVQHIRRAAGGLLLFLFDGAFGLRCRRRLFLRTVRFKRSESVRVGVLFDREADFFAVALADDVACISVLKTLTSASLRRLRVSSVG